MVEAIKFYLTRLGLFILSLMALILFSFFSFNSIAIASETSSKLNSAKAEKAKVIYFEVKKTSDTTKFIFPAKIEAKYNTAVSSDIDAYVKKIVKPLGSKLNKNDVVLYLENKDPAYTYAQVAIRAPIDGVLSQLDVKELLKVQKGQKLFTVIKPDAVRTTVEVPAAQVEKMSQIKNGIFIQTLSDKKELPIKLIGMSPVVDSRTGTATAEIEFDLNQMKKLNLVAPIVGTVGQVIFISVAGEIISVPETAISFLEGQPMVRVVGAENKILRKKLTVKEQRENFYIIEDGLSIGDKVVLRSNKSLKEGEAVDADNVDKKNEESNKDEKSTQDKSNG